MIFFNAGTIKSFCVENAKKMWNVLKVQTPLLKKIESTPKKKLKNSLFEVIMVNRSCPNGGILVQ